MLLVGMSVLAQFGSASPDVVHETTGLQVPHVQPSDFWDTWSIVGEDRSDSGGRSGSNSRRVTHIDRWIEI